MAWFEAHDSLPRHPKTLKLARLLKISRREAVGLLYDLFAWAINVARKNGELPGLIPEDIAQALDFPPKKAGQIVGALMDAGYLEQVDGTYCIHDWYDYAGKLFDSREKNREKNQRYRERKKAEMQEDT